MKKWKVMSLNRRRDLAQSLDLWEDDYRNVLKRTAETFATTRDTYQSPQSDSDDFSSFVNSSDVLSETDYHLVARKKKKRKKRKRKEGEDEEEEQKEIEGYHVKKRKKIGPVNLKNLDSNRDKGQHFFDIHPYSIRWNPEAFRLLVLGKSGSGKTNQTLSWLSDSELIRWRYLIIFSKRAFTEPKFKELQVKFGEDRVKLFEDLKDLDKFPPGSLPKQSVILFDDFHFSELRHPIIAEYFSSGRKDGNSIIVITQLLGNSDDSKEALEIRNDVLGNATDFMLFKIGNDDEVRKMYGKFSDKSMNCKQFVWLYRQFTKQPFNFMHIDTRIADTPLLAESNNEPEKKKFNVDFSTLYYKCNFDNAVKIYDRKGGPTKSIPIQQYNFPRYTA